MKNIKKLITNRRSRLAIIAFVTVIGFVISSCPSPTGDDDPGKDLGKKAGAAVSAPVLASKTHNSITIKAVAAPGNGQTVEYAKNGTNSPPSTGWQDGLTFSGLSPSTTYWIFARSKANAAYNTGKASAGLSVTTDPDTTPPVLSGGSLNRTSDTAALITFTSDKAGTAYYSQLAGGAAAPSSEAVTTDNTIGSVIAGTNIVPVTLTAGVRDIYLVVEDAAGNVSLPLKIEAPSYVAMFYSIGDPGPGGGIIFYVDSSGFTVEGYTGAAGSFEEYIAHYLEAAPSNSSDAAEWGAMNILIPGVTTFPFAEGADYNKIGNGRKDTLTIAAYLDTNTDETGRAAQLAAAASFNGFNDWFLPSCGELNLLYLERNLSGFGFTEYDGFWSSSQVDNYIAWQQYFINAGPHNHLKYFTSAVRSIRAF